ncbi:WW domain-containing protein [Zunongwangia sp. F260]|uniref:WW domain-containing protein n=1 Tax=Autumnicola lenta TaxID=3075593 RepID=A0ABU3CMV3_9FLAO|nr:WW domain-containing protein [Zunongwangia sp. F260]MDT0647651.1 WW domain-containing protein [Zunongwangia sp. F260]
MKKIICLLAFLCLGFTALAQTTEEETTPVDTRDITKNELSFNAFNLVAFGIFDLSYERVITENSTWSTELFLHLNKDDYYDEAYYKDVSVTGKYKHFFSSSYARGFYVHGFGMISNGEYESTYYYDSVTGESSWDREDYTDFAVGFGLGGKFISSGGFLLDLSGGIGRNLFNNAAPEIIGQFMVNLGYRF